jgi:hypothetical protein
LVGQAVNMLYRTANQLLIWEYLIAGVARSVERKITEGGL